MVAVEGVAIAGGMAAAVVVAACFCFPNMALISSIESTMRCMKDLISLMIKDSFCGLLMLCPSELGILFLVFLWRLP